ncbi:MAG: HypC/HybG/HupF family hydrogenase formation chaperone [Firmicutes bacterium]|nr:HypC/HybG/HupF family hydrogenase formation chaperone [Bacillota bacterium]
MCLAAPGRVVAVDRERQMATVEYFGNEREVGVALVPEVQVGDFVMVHAGEAIEIVDADEAEASLALWTELYGLDDAEGL